MSRCFRLPRRGWGCRCRAYDGRGAAAVLAQVDRVSGAALTYTAALVLWLAVVLGLVATATEPALSDRTKSALVLLALAAAILAVLRHVGTL
jgi:hypothetical protein